MSDNTHIPSDLYMMLGKMDGKLDQNLAATANLANEVKELANTANVHHARIAVLEKDAETLRKHGHEIANIKQSLEGRPEQVREFREVANTVRKIDTWCTDHDAQEKAKSKMALFVKSIIPIAVSLVGALGISLTVQSKHEEKTTPQHHVNPPAPSANIVQYR